jgi:hypothetical protein
MGGANRATEDLVGAVATETLAAPPARRMREKTVAQELALPESLIWPPRSNSIIILHAGAKFAGVL